MMYAADEERKDNKKGEIGVRSSAATTARIVIRGTQEKEQDYEYDFPRAQAPIMPLGTYHKTT